MRGITVTMVIGIVASFLACEAVLAQERFSEEHNVRARFEWWAPEVEGDIKGDEGFIIGDQIDMEKILDAEVTGGVPYLELDFRLGEYDWLDVTGFRLRMASENRRLPANPAAGTDDWRWNGVDFLGSIGERVDTAFQLSDFRMAYDRTLLLRAEGKSPVDLNVFGGFSYVAWEQKIRGAGGSPEDDSYSLMPVLGFRAETAFWKIIALSAEFSLGYLDWGDYKTRTYGIDFEIGWNFTEIASLRLGFRRYVLDMEAEDGEGTDETDWTLDGLSLSLVCKF